MTDTPDSVPSTPSPAAEARTVTLRSAAYRTFIYRKMIRAASPDVTPGDVVTVLDRHGRVFGSGLYNPRSEIALRMLTFDDRTIDDGFWREAVQRAVDLRRDVLGLDRHTSAYRVIHAEGDGLSGLVVDRYADVLSVQVYSLGIFRLLDMLLPVLHEACGTRRQVVDVDERTCRAEGMTSLPDPGAAAPRSVKVAEHDIRFKVRFDLGHKTGFFCDQRDNRLRLASRCAGARVLDVCCYSGGFGLYAKLAGEACEVTCVDLDEHAIDMARDNMNLNGARLRLVCGDAFPYLRQMQTNGEVYDTVVLDPPKFIFGHNDTAEGHRKYHDLNRLAMAVVRPGGLLVTCSCSGALSRPAFERLILAAARSAGRSLQILEWTGAAPDHPIRPESPEAAYLKVAWLRVL